MVYVVDDDFGVLGSLRFLLETDEFEVEDFSSGSALLDSVGSVGPDCFVIDYKMPTMNGIELAGSLRKLGINKPIILVTGYPDKDILAKAKAAGIVHVLFKPHLEESLVNHIRAAIQTKSAA
jgi:FixJ family two-component response regulator